MASSEGHQNCIFFDNEERNIRDVARCSNILCVKVGGLEVKPPEIDVRTPEFKDHIKDLDPFFISVLCSVSCEEIEAGIQTMEATFDTTSGLTDDDYVTLERWYTANGGSSSDKKYAIFDFDRTISTLEVLPSTEPTKGNIGFKGIIDTFITTNTRLNWFLNSKSKKQDIMMAKQNVDNFLKSLPDNKHVPDVIPTIEQFVQFLCGLRRIPLLRKIFTFCRTNDIKILIVTNNRTSTYNQLLYTNIMSVLMDSPLFEVHYSGDIGKAQKLVDLGIGRFGATGGTRHSQRNRSSRSRRRRQSVKRRTQPRKPVSHRRVRRQ